MDYYDFELDRISEPNPRAIGETREGKIVTQAAEILTTEKGNHILRVYIPPNEPQFAGDITSQHVGRTVDVSGVSGTIVEVRHYGKAASFTQIAWEDGSTSTVPSGSSARLLD